MHQTIESAVNAKGHVLVLIPPQTCQPTHVELDGDVVHLILVNGQTGGVYRIAKPSADSAKVAGRLLVVEINGANVLREGLLPLSRYRSQ